MRYSLLNFLVCPQCAGELTAVVLEEAPAEMNPVRLAQARRVNQAGSQIGPTPAWRSTTALTRLLDRLSESAASPERNFQVDVTEGLLVCGECGRWFPLTRSIPELLPDHLRDSQRDAALMHQCAPSLPAELGALLRGPAGAGHPHEDAGAHHKRAEMSIKDKISDPSFFGPGYSSPFNPWNPDFTLYLIRVFANVLPLLELKEGDAVLDTGCGYAWTTEWLFRSGFEAIGSDISRVYVDIAVERMGAVRPHLVIADTENLPFKSDSMRGVLGYESFHHIPNRRRAMAGFARILQEGSPVVLAEPGAAHEHAEVSVDAMTKYGILEKGMEIEDIEDYIESAPFGAPEQHYVVRAASAELGGALDLAFARTHAVVEGNIFRIRKTSGGLRPAVARARRSRRVIWPRVKRELRSWLVRAGLD